jgi:hypothetical protein
VSLSASILALFQTHSVAKQGERKKKEKERERDVNVC